MNKLNYLLSVLLITFAVLLAVTGYRVLSPGLEGFMTKTEDSTDTAIEVSNKSGRPSFASLCPEETRYNDLDEALKNSEKVCALGLVGEGLSEFPLAILKLTNLKELYLGKNKLTRLPKEIGNLTNLWILRLPDNNLSTFPEEMKSLSRLEELILTGNNFSQAEKERIERIFPKALVVF